MWEVIDGVSQAISGRKTTESIKADTCVFCDRPATEFKDELSRTEFSLSGMCQHCQDGVFGDDSDVQGQDRY